jgi:phosphotriesterase-related protein
VTTIPTETTDAELAAQSVCGPVPASRLGRVLCHEHVVLRTPGFAESYPWTYSRRDVIEECVDVLSGLLGAGVSTIIDHTTIDLGRDAELLAEVSDRSGITIVAATGCHLVTPRFVFNRSPDAYAELLMSDLVTGIAGTGIRAGVIKCATDLGGVTPENEAILRACARAHLGTGAPISTHTHAAGRVGLDQLAIFADEGVDPRRVLIGHSGDSRDLGYLAAMAARGAYLGADRFGGEVWCSESERVELVARLCASGFAGLVMLAHDTNVWSEKEPPGWRERFRPQWHFRHIIDEVVPRLLALGVTPAQIDQMLITNPAEFFPYLPVSTRQPSTVPTHQEERIS